MDILLDSHILIWALAADERLSRRATELISIPENAIYYSAASVWELSIKHALHPESVAISAEEIIDISAEAGFIHLPVKDRHSVFLETLSLPEEAPAHKDPFDRMLIAQAKAEGMVLLTHDKLMANYGEQCVFLV